MLISFILLSIISEWSCCSALSPTLDAISLFNLNHSNEHKVISCRGFNLHFPDNYNEHIFMCLLAFWYTFFLKCLSSLLPIFNKLVWSSSSSSLLFICRDNLDNLNISIWFMYCRFFFHFVVYPFVLMVTFDEQNFDEVIFIILL